MSKDASFDFHFFQNVLEFLKDYNKKKNNFETKTIVIVVKKVLFFQNDQTLIFVKDSRVSFPSLLATNHHLHTFLLSSSKAKIIQFWKGIKASLLCFMWNLCKVATITIIFCAHHNHIPE
jgi:hypothetical protein